MRVQAACAGSATLLAVMNSTFTVTAHYASSLPLAEPVAAAAGGGEPAGVVDLIEPVTARAAHNADLVIRATPALLCAPGAGVVRVEPEADGDPAVFPVNEPALAVYRPNDVRRECIAPCPACRRYAAGKCSWKQGAANSVA